MNIDCTIVNSFNYDVQMMFFFYFGESFIQGWPLDIPFQEIFCNFSFYLLDVLYCIELYVTTTPTKILLL